MKMHMRNKEQLEVWLVAAELL